MCKSLFGLGITALVLSVASVSGQELGTMEQARAMLDRAVSALKSNEATALSEFNNPNNKQFHERDLYVFCYDVSDGKITADESPALLSVDVRTLPLKDEPIGKRAYEAVQNAPEGSINTIDYKFPKPGTTEPVLKQTLEMRIGNQGCGVTYYKVSKRSALASVAMMHPRNFVAISQACFTAPCNLVPSPLFKKF